MISRQEAVKRKKAMKRRMFRKSKKKVNVIFVISVIFLFVLVCKIISIIYTNGESYSKIVMNTQSYSSVSIPYKRGQIEDRNGMVLAYSEKVYNLILDPKQNLTDSDGKKKQPTIEALVKYFNIDRSKLEDIFSNRKESHYEKLLVNLTEDAIKDFKEFSSDDKNNVCGVWFEENYIRNYPFSTLASNVIGFSSQANGGETGIENYYNEELTGTDGMSVGYVGEDLEVEKEVKNPVDGYNIVTTIDYKIQDIIEKNIKKLYEERPAKNISVLAMNPKNGEILAMADYPTYDLNNPRDLSSVYTDEQLKAMSDDDIAKALTDIWSNYCVYANYEPGSTFKTFTVASGLEEGVTQDGEIFHCDGYEEVNGVKIGCYTIRTGGHGDITLEDSLGESCNVAMMKIAARLESKRMSEYQKLFGFGSRTGVDLPNESTGIALGENMSNVDAACCSFGQTVNVTMVQMASAFSSVINGGKYYKPHIVKKIVTETGETVKNIEPELVRQTVTEETSETLRKYLKNSVDNGLVKRVGIAGYSIGGKTGTAQKLPRADKKWIVSYLGCVPTDDPQIVLYTVIDEPFETNGTEGSTPDALDLSRNIYEELLPYLNIFKDQQADSGTDNSDTPIEGMVALPE